MYYFDNNGKLYNLDGTRCSKKRVEESKVSVKHLDSHVEKFVLSGGEEVKILIRYSCHCWSEETSFCGENEGVFIIDGSRFRIFDRKRYGDSLILKSLITNIHENCIYVTNVSRNYGTYDAVMVNNEGESYTAFISIKKKSTKRAKFNGVRYSLILYVESAYYKVQPENGKPTNFSAVVSKALKGEMVKYRR